MPPESGAGLQSWPGGFNPWNFRPDFQERFVDALGF
jgi:hypothetical protein